MDDVRIIRKTQQIHEVDFMMLGTAASFSFNLLTEQGDEVKELNDCFVVLKKSTTPSEVFTIYKRNLLVRSDRIKTVDIIPPGESALDKHLEFLKTEQTRPVSAT